VIRAAFVPLLLLGWAPAASAGGVVALGDERVAQYKEALQAAREVLHDAAIVDSTAADAVERLRSADPGVIIAVGQKALQLAARAAPSTPTVFCMVLGASAVASRNVTGVKLEVAPALQLGLIKKVDPDAKRVGLIYDPKTSAPYFEEASKAAGALGLTLVARQVSDAREVRSALSAIAGGIDALWLIPDPHLISAEMFNFLLVFTIEHKIALFGFLDTLTQAGALASVAPDYREIGRRAARMAGDLLAKPTESRLPVPPLQASPGALSVNLKTATQLGLKVSTDVLAKARQVYK
jgi:putative ABC transport system substrate-binding protein